MGDDFQRRLESYRYYDGARNFKFKTRKFADISAVEEVTMGRGAAPTHCSQYRHTILELHNNHIAPLDFLVPAQPVS